MASTSVDAKSSSEIVTTKTPFSNKKLKNIMIVGLVFAAGVFVYYIIRKNKMNKSGGGMTSGYAPPPAAPAPAPPLSQPSNHVHYQQPARQPQQQQTPPVREHVHVMHRAQAANPFGVEPPVSSRDSKLGDPLPTSIEEAIAMSQVSNGHRHQPPPPPPPPKNVADTSDSHPL
jgi:hypothetical protein